MKSRNAEEVIGGFTRPQNTRLSMYRNNLSKDKDNCFFDDKLVEELMQYARNQKNVETTLGYLKGIGYTASRYEWKQIDDQVRRFTDVNHSNFAWNKHFKQAKQELLAEVSRWKLQELQYVGNESIVRVIPRKETHAGFSYLVTGKKSKREYLEDVFQVYTLEKTTAKETGSFNKPIMIGSRTQAGGAFTHTGERTGKFKSKTRLVSMIDIFQIIGEMEFAVPFQSRLGQTTWYAGGKDDGQILSHLSTRRASYSNSITIDYSHFDQSISDWLIRETFDVIKHAFSSGGTYFDERLFSVLREDFINKVFLNGDGSLMESHKGVPSGSMFTQIVDSIANRLMISTYMKSQGITEYDMMIMGDDNIIFTKQLIDLSSLSSYLVRNFGVTVNPDKCSQVTTDSSPEFLSRIWTHNGVYREPNMLLVKLAYTERFRDYDLGFEPDVIIDAYNLTFPLGMDELIHLERFRTKVRSKNVTHGSDLKWMTGLMRYRQLYLIP